MFKCMSTQLFPRSSRPALGLFASTSRLHCFIIIDSENGWSARFCEAARTYVNKKLTPKQCDEVHTTNRRKRVKSQRAIARQYEVSVKVMKVDNIIRAGATE